MRRGKTGLTLPTGIYFHENSSVIIWETLFQSFLCTSCTFCINLNLIGPVFRLELIKNQLPQAQLHNRKGREEGVSLQHIIAEFQNAITTSHLIGMLRFLLEMITGPVRKLFMPINHLLPSCPPCLRSMARGSHYEVIIGN